MSGDAYTSAWETQPEMYKLRKDQGMVSVTLVQTLAPEIIQAASHDLYMEQL